MNHEYITFELGSQIFGLDIMTIREIRAWTPMTRLPHVPDYVAGVINLRGVVLPIVDLAKRLGWAATEPTARHAIMVTQLDGQWRGLIVDMVRDIVSIPDESLQPPPAVGDSGLNQFIAHVATFEERMVAILNLHAINSADPVAEAA